MADDLVERLRKAADAIETLTRERDEARALLREAGEALDELISDHEYMTDREEDNLARLAARAILARIKESAGL